MDAVTKKAIDRLQVFTDFLDGISGRTGYLGGAITEVGIPHADTRTTPSAAAIADAPLWQKLADAWYTHADDHGLWITGWASGNWGHYNLGIHSNDSDYTPSGTNLDFFLTPGMLDVLEAHPPQGSATWRRGADLAGMDFGHRESNFTNLNSGGLNDGTPLQFFAPTAGDVAALAARRVRTIRLAVSWERLQPTLLGALDTTFLGYITTVADACLTNGIGCIIELHNYARYDLDNAGAKRVMALRTTAGQSLTDPGTDRDGTMGPEYLIDVWRRISNVYRTHAGVVSYELMNEPHDVPATAGAFSGTVMYPWATTIQGWAGGDGSTTPSFASGEGHTATGALQLVKAGAAFTNVRGDDAGQRLLDPGAGTVLSYWLKIASGAPAGTYTAKAQWQNASFAYQEPVSVAYFDASGASIPNPVRGSWCEVRSTFSAITSPNAYAIQVDCPSTTTLTMWVDDFTRGSVTGAYSDVQAWEYITQQVLTDLRTRPDDTSKRDTKTVLVPGMGWNVLGWNHASAWITEPSGLEGTHLYCTHHYFDSNAAGTDEGRGVYDTATLRYADAETRAIAQGFTDDADTTAPTISSLGHGTPTGTAATITWNTTGQSSDSRVEYGLNSLPAGVYGSSTVRDTALVTSHSVGLSGLSPGLTYRYRSRSRDAAGNLAISSEGTFATAAAGGISNVVANPLSSTSVEITWTTSVASSSQVEYGTSAGPPYPFSSTFDATQVTSHSVILTGLNQATTYHFRPLSWVIP